MSDRFAGLSKIPQEPAARLLANEGIRLKTKLDAPASAPVEAVLAELEAKEAWIDVLKLLATALPVRERIWWSCLAARDLLEEKQKPWPTLVTTEAWVFQPTEENRIKVREALDAVQPDEESELCAFAASAHDGVLGPGDMSEVAAPPGATALAAFAMNVKSLGVNKETFDAHMQHLIERGLDIARGGNGAVKPAPAKEPAAGTEPAAEKQE